MSNPCESYRESMRSALTDSLSHEQALQVAQHVRSCAACALYQKNLAADDGLLSSFAKEMGSTVVGIERAVMEAIERQAPVQSPRTRFWRPAMRFAAAAVIVCGLLLLAAYLLWPLGRPTVTLADTLETMRQAPWIHVIQTMGSDEAHRYECWEHLGARILAQKNSDGRTIYAEYGQNAMYAYNPKANKITVSFTADSYRIEPLWNPLTALSKAIAQAEAGGAEVSRDIEREGGVRVEKIRAEFDNDAGHVQAIYVRDVERNVLLREETAVVGDGSKHTYTTLYDYPGQGPEDIYALGVPRDAAILDIRPEGPALALIDTVQTRFERGFGDHLAVVLQSWLDEDGTREPTEIAILRRKGDLKRCDIYHSYDFSRRSDGPPSLYSQVKGAWPDLTIPQVLAIADANALEMRMLFDGQGTIRWRRVGRQMVREEYRTDEFKTPLGPAPHSLAALVWSNLHLRLAMGSSQMKREVRLLPDDPDRPGLVGLQFVEFATTEDYWFDPDKDYMLIERIRKQEGQGITSRSAAIETAQTADGQWYPSVVEIASNRANDADPTSVLRRELRVQVDANPTFGDDVFLVDESPTESDVGPVETEPAPKTQADKVAEQMEGPVGRIQDEWGNPIPGATVLLYHMANRYGLGNAVVAQTETDDDGGYVLTEPLEFEHTESHAYAQDAYVLIAIHPDYAFAWKSMRPAEEAETCDLTLTTPVSRSIAVTDDEGHPLRGARVWLYRAGDGASANPLFRDNLSLPTDIGVLGAITDVNGIALVTNLPDTGCSFHATLDGYATGLAFPGQHHIRLSPGAGVSGWVLNDAGEPVSGALVRLKTEWMYNYFLSESDDEGHFALLNLPAEGWDTSPWGQAEPPGTGEYTLTVEHERFAGIDRTLHLAPGETRDNMIVEVFAGATLVRCHVLDEDTREPVPGARLRGTNAIGEINGCSDANGVFTTPVLPGTTMLQVYSPPDGIYVGARFMSTKNWRVTFEAKGSEMDVAVISPRAEGRLISVSGLVVEADNAPVAGAVVNATAGEFYTSTAGSHIDAVGTDPDGQFELNEVPAGRELHLYVQTKDRAFAASDIVSIPADANEAAVPTLVLQPTEKATVLLDDDEGRPLMNRAICIRPKVGDQINWSVEHTVTTDSLGVFEADGIVPGLTYFLRDAKHDDTDRRLPEGQKDWFKREMVLIPIEP